MKRTGDGVFNGRKVRRNGQTDWPAEVARFCRDGVRCRRYRLSSPGVAQVTRVRILRSGVAFSVRTEGDVLVFER